MESHEHNHDNSREDGIRRLLHMNNELHDLFNENDAWRHQCTNIGRMECSLLQLLYRAQEPICMNDLAEYLGVSHSRITRIVDNLVKKKLVRRYPSDDDRRRWFTEISETGTSTARDSYEQMQQFQKELIRNIPSERVTCVIDCLEAYIEAFKKALPTHERL